VLLATLASGVIGVLLATLVSGVMPVAEMMAAAVAILATSSQVVAHA